MEELGVEDPDAYLALDIPDTATAEEAVRRLLAMPEPPTALFTANNWITAGALRAFRTVDPDALPALVGFDDLDLGDLLGVTVIAHDPEEMGRLAAETAVGRFGGASGPMRTTKLPTRLIRRGSGERPLRALRPTS